MSTENDIFNDKNLEKEAPLLSAIPKRNPFTVPEGYFESLPLAIMEKCREGKPMPQAGTKIFWLFRPQWMMAVFACLVGLGFLLRNNNKPLPFETLASQVADSTIYQNLQSNIDDIDEGTIEDALQSDNAIKTAPSDTTNQQQIINYLINHNIDASDIENEM